MAGHITGDVIMAQVINTNVPSLSAQSNLNRTNSGLTQALERLSSGKRINSAKDDAAGIAIASRFTAQIRGYNQGTRNAADAISLAQTAEGAYDEISGNLQRIRELAVQSANATNSSTDRAALQTEVKQLQDEINRVAETKFNGKAIIGSSATAAGYVFQVGPDNTTNDKITVNTTGLSDLGGYAAVAGGVEGTVGTVSTAAKAQALIDNVDTFLQSVNTERATLGAVQNRFESVIRNGENSATNLAAARSRIEDADFAQETANLTKYQILQQAGTSVLAQANALPQSVLGLLS